MKQKHYPQNKIFLLLAFIYLTSCVYLLSQNFSKTLVCFPNPFFNHVVKYFDPVYTKVKTERVPSTALRLSHYFCGLQF